MAIVLLGIVILLSSAASTFFYTQVDGAVERQNIYSEIDAAFEDMKVRCVSSILPYTVFASGGSTQNLLRFQGETNIYAVTPDTLTDNCIYQYYVNVSGDLVLRTDVLAGWNIREDVLVERKFRPTLQFRYSAGDEPNFLTVTITATTPKAMMGGRNTITKTDGIRFWFINLVV